MLTRVPVQPKDVDAYRPIVGDEIVDGLRARAEEFEGARVLHVNSTAYGGGVAEILYTLVPLMSGLGLDAEWQIIEADADFFEVTKFFHNALQGMEIPTTRQMTESTCAGGGEHPLFRGRVRLRRRARPPALRHAEHARGDGGEARQVGLALPHRHHRAQEDAWGFLRPFIDSYDAADLHQGRLHRRTRSGWGAASSRPPSTP